MPFRDPTVHNPFGVGYYTENRFVEQEGGFDLDINKARVEHWLSQGARPSDSVRTLLAKHLVRDLSPQPAPAE